MLWLYINDEEKMDEKVWDIPLEHFFNAKIEATPAQATAKSEEENAAFDVFFNKLKHIFK
jgi:hypothetical protein